jgi:alkane 1-monooxygenase
MKFRALKYLSAFFLPVMTAVSFTHLGWLTFLPVAFSFIVLPIIEYWVGLSEKNFSAAEEEVMRKDFVYDFILYLTVPTQVCFSVWFLWSLTHTNLSALDIVGRTFSMGLMNGVFGINIAHELGHRNTWHEKLMSKTMLATTLFLHFYIEHNRGHHRNVATPDDAATARKNESLYAFWIRTVYHSFVSAWFIVKRERVRKKQNVWSVQNEMVQYLLIQLFIVGCVALVFPLWILGCFLIAALLGILLLEAVNYTEHYGLLRKKINENRYEDVGPQHSWNSDYIIGRVVLFELTRHSDHHYDPSKPYQILDSLNHSSQLPAGYPAMILLSLVPPAWFRVMNKRLPKEAS